MCVREKKKERERERERERDCITKAELMAVVLTISASGTVSQEKDVCTIYQWMQCHGLNAASKHCIFLVVFDSSQVNGVKTGTLLSPTCQTVIGQWFLLIAICHWDYTAPLKLCTM